MQSRCCVSCREIIQGSLGGRGDVVDYVDELLIVGCSDMSFALGFPGAC
jgi:hypothetical protein